MAKKAETVFREGHVMPFLKTLENCAFFSIQQVTIVGDADIICCINGHFVWLELKRRGEKSRKIQVFKADWVKRCKGTAIEAKPENWATVKQTLAMLNGGASHENQVQGPV